LTAAGIKTRVLEEFKKEKVYIMNSLFVIIPEHPEEHPERGGRPSSAID
jgi:hypothetical protein